MSRFIRNFEGEISLLDLLKNMSFVSGRDFACSPASCEDIYQAYGAGSASKNFEIISGQDNYYGFKIPSGSNVRVQEIEFNVSLLNSLSSCVNQLSLDLLADGTNDFQNTNYEDV